LIPFEFEFYTPETVEEAVKVYMTAKSKGLLPMYYSGGTEFISRARRNEIKVDLVIDIKRIDACKLCKSDEHELTLGAAVTLTEIIEANLFPLLSDVARSIATRTARNKITIGGNMMSNLPYKEALLPFLLADSEVVIAGEQGVRQVNIHDVYTDCFSMAPEEWIVQIITNAKALQASYYHEKRTRQSQINYPLVTATSLFESENTRIALSGMSNNPIRVKQIEDVANDLTKAKDVRVVEMVEALPTQIIDNEAGSSGYREFVLQGMFYDILSKREELQI